MDIKIVIQEVGHPTVTRWDVFMKRTEIASNKSKFFGYFNTYHRALICAEGVKNVLEDHLPKSKSVLIENLGMIQLELKYNKQDKQAGNA